MYKVLLLICTVGMHQSECTVDTAVNVIRGPDAYDLASCGLKSQAYLAGTVIGRNLTHGEYPKIICQRTGIGGEHFGQTRQTRANPPA